MTWLWVAGAQMEPQGRSVIVLMIQLITNTDIGTTFPTLVYQALMEASNSRMERR